MSASKDGKGNGRAEGDEEIVKEKDPKTMDSTKIDVI